MEIPASVTAIGNEAFSGCDELRRVVFAEGSRLERIGEKGFYFAHIEELTLPGTLKELGEKALDCWTLSTLRVEGDGELNLEDAGLSGSSQVILLSAPRVGDVLVQDLKQLKDVVIPEGVERIGNYWFWGSNIESVEIPASVREIGGCAFCNCENLKRVVFAEGSRLEKIGPWSFCNTGIAEICIPNGAKEIQRGAFTRCSKLTSICLSEGLERIGV